VHLLDDGKKGYERRCACEKIPEMGSKPRFGLVSLVISPCDRFHGMAWDDGRYGLLTLVLSLGHAHKLFSLN
jgi:hypothetical protein